MKHFFSLPDRRYKINQKKEGNNEDEHHPHNTNGSSIARAKAQQKKQQHSSFGKSEMREHYGNKYSGQEGDILAIKK